MPRDFGPDVSHRVDVDSRSLVPDGPAPTGHRLTVTGQEPFEFAWRQPEEKQVREGNGDPNGVVTAPKGTLYVERDAPSLWQNDDGLTSWAQLGAGSATDPDSFDYLEAEDTFTNTGLTSDVEVFVDFNVVGANTSGTDISIDGSDDILINADGIYAAEFGLQMTSEVDGDTFSQASGRIHVERAVRGDVELRDYRLPILPSVRHYSEMHFAWTGFMHANDKFELHAQMAGGGADTWTSVGWAFVQRIA